MQVKLPYGREKLAVTIDDDQLQGILISRTDEYKTELSQKELVKRALANPEDSPRLKELAADRKQITIITSDHTRPVPSKITMPLLLAEIRRGNPQAEITILIATGFHRSTTDSELREKFGHKIVDEEKIVVHDSRNEDSLRYVGTLPSGGDLVLNKLALDSDLLVAEGFIEPHFFAGYSGGRKSILPGIASKKTVLANHSAEFIDHPQARTGILEGNPLHKDMLYAADEAGLNFILNVVINSDKEIIKAVAGHYESAHRQGCNFLADLAVVEKEPANIVITTNGGYPLDQNIYQSVKGMTAAEATCREGGVIIIAAACIDGHGGQDFYNTFAEADSVKEVMAQICARDRQETVPDQWESQILARILLKHEVIMVTEAPEAVVTDLKMRYAESIEEALVLAENISCKKKNEITLIPDGVAVIVK